VLVQFSNIAPCSGQYYVTNSVTPVKKNDQEFIDMGILDLIVTARTACSSCSLRKQDLLRDGLFYIMNIYIMNIVLFNMPAIFSNMYRSLSVE